MSEPVQARLAAADAHTLSKKKGKGLLYVSNEI